MAHAASAATDAAVRKQLNRFMQVIFRAIEDYTQSKPSIALQHPERVEAVAREAYSAPALEVLFMACVFAPVLKVL